MRPLFAAIFIFPLLALAGCSDAGTELSVVSYNIRAGKGMDNRLNLAGTVATLRRQHADVLLLQEVDMDTARSGKVSQAAEIAAQLGMHYFFAPAMNYGGGQYGNAILSKFPLENTHTLALAGGGEPRSAAFAEIVKNGKRVALVSVHMDLNENFHAAHARLISDSAKKFRTAPAVPVIWGGDFNADEKSALWQTLAPDWTLAAKTGANRKTYPADAPDSEIDWFLFTPNDALRVVRHEVIAEPATSDHRPVALTAELK